MADWNAIRSDYESGKMSLRRLALAYGVSKTYLIERRDRENWAKPTTDRPPTDHLAKPASPRTKSEKKVPTTLFIQPPPPADAIEIARAGLRQLAESFGDNPPEGLLSLHDHKLLSDSLSQYVKVLVSAPQETGQGITIDLAKLSPSKRIALRQLLSAPESEAL